MRQYFTLRKAQELVRVKPECLSNAALQKHIVKLRDFKRYIDTSDMPRLIMGGYFLVVTDPSATGFTPKDIWLQTNLGTALDETYAEKETRLLAPNGVKGE